LQEENKVAVHKFLEDNKNFILEDICDFLPSTIKKESCRDGYIELYPNIDGIDGFFIARLRRVN
jgi:16S rRNA (cytosine967-C5)-methyltransferase